MSVYQWDPQFAAPLHLPRLLRLLLLLSCVNSAHDPPPQERRRADPTEAETSKEDEAELEALAPHTRCDAAAGTHAAGARATKIHTGKDLTSACTWL
eukprot:COSAG05_NODE_8936_length_660_cov_0.773619_1_plen_97_part_00